MKPINLNCPECRKPLSHDHIKSLTDASAVIHKFAMLEIGIGPIRESDFLCEDCYEEQHLFDTNINVPSEKTMDFIKEGLA